MSHNEFKPGWFKDTLHRAALSIRAGHHRTAAISYGNTDPFPLGWDDADELALELSARFESWTGRTLEQHFAIRSQQIADQEYDAEMACLHGPDLTRER